MKVTIHQPNFLPYLGFFDKCDYADLVVLYDSTQFKKNDFQNRNKIKDKNGWFWLTVPINHKFGEKIKNVRVDNTRDWKTNHLKAIETCYSGSKYFKEYFYKIKEIYEREWVTISAFNIELIRFFLKELNIQCKVFLSSELDIKNFGTLALIEICNKTEYGEYVSGKDGKNYLDFKEFEKKGLKLEFQNYQHPIYSQKFGEFVPYMCILDLLFNEGPNSLKIIKTGRKYESKC